MLNRPHKIRSTPNKLVLLILPTLLLEQLWAPIPPFPFLTPPLMLLPMPLLLPPILVVEEVEEMVEEPRGGSTAPGGRQIQAQPKVAGVEVDK
jgi:hypothetical protein